MSDELEVECHLLVCLISKSRKFKQRKQVSKCIAELTAKMVNEANNMFGKDFIATDKVDFICDYSLDFCGSFS